ncbi:hypothetical protein LSG31_04395 [Fodinisporobacter ferrooxydans]|uniref:DUF2281 domain-containing protein n=1 Tax=Fodinisporobacter ferrooxydans TaxID=2901836 RepID=A0ABY4CLW4_9BACL|nr:hypothetical protein LSG31_04395 [Alicyclobacillaceae bacterium MYW30-H2]
MIDKNELHMWVDKLTTDDQKTVFDFVQYLVERRDRNEVEKFYGNIPEVDEPYSEEELRQMKENTGWVDWEVLERDLSKSSLHKVNRFSRRNLQINFSRFLKAYPLLLRHSHRIAYHN